MKIILTQHSNYGRVLKKQKVKNNVSIFFAVVIIFYAIILGLQLMLQKEIYFFGKLNQFRDFIASNNLNVDDKDFWNGWFERCSCQDKLIPFTRKSFGSQRAWLFCMKLPNNIFYVGLAAASSDRAGRKCPFILFCKPEQYSELRASVEFIASHTAFFLQVVKAGSYTAIDLNTNNFQFALPVSFLHYLHKNATGSFWLESESGLYIEHENPPSCSLFNKLFGL